VTNALKVLFWQVFVSASLIVFAISAPAAPAHAQEQQTALEVHGTLFDIDAATGLTPYVAQAIEVVTEHWPRVAAATGASEGERVEIHFEHRFDDWFEREQVPAQPPEYAIGLALPWRRTILMVPGNTEWRSTLVHELTHVAVAMAAHDGDVPVWFTEGLAVSLANQWDFEKASVLVNAARTGGILPMESIADSWPQQADRAALAYAQGNRFVEWVRREFGEDVWTRVLPTMSEESTFASSYQAVTGELLSVSYDRFESSMAARAGWGPLLVGFLALVSIVAGIVGYAWWRRIAERRRRLERLGQQERNRYGSDPDDTTFA
jgi:hypothetical protein